MISIIIILLNEKNISGYDEVSLWSQIDYYFIMMSGILLNIDTSYINNFVTIQKAATKISFKTKLIDHFFFFELQPLSDKRRNFALFFVDQ